MKEYKIDTPWKKFLIQVSMIRSACTVIMFGILIVVVLLMGFGLI